MVHLRKGPFLFNQIGSENFSVIILNACVVPTVLFELLVTYETTSPSLVWCTSCWLEKYNTWNTTRKTYAYEILEDTFETMKIEPNKAI